MRCAALTLTDLPRFNRFLDAQDHELSAYAFANIHIWRTLFTIRWALIQGSLCIFFRDAVGMFMYLPPLGPALSRGVIETCFKVMDRHNPNRAVSRIENIEEEQRASFERLGLFCRHSRDEYVYSRVELSALAGDRFKSKRWAYNYFVGHYRWQTVAYDRRYRAACLKLYRKWMRQCLAKGRSRVYAGMLADSFAALRVALGDAARLGLIGKLVFVDGKLAAFTFGFRLSRSMFCVLYEVTDLSVKGASQFVFRSFCEENKTYPWINAMDDSGLDNIRAVKRSYRPRRLVPSFTATRSDADGY